MIRQPSRSARFRTCEGPSHHFQDSVSSTTGTFGKCRLCAPCDLGAEAAHLLESPSRPIGVVCSRRSSPIPPICPAAKNSASPSPEPCERSRDPLADEPTAISIPLLRVRFLPYLTYQRGAARHASLQRTITVCSRSARQGDEDPEQEFL